MAYACVFTALGGSVPSNFAVTQSTVYVGDGVHTVYYEPPAHTQPYYVKVTVTADGAQVDSAGKVVLVSAPAAALSAFTSVALNGTSSRSSQTSPTNSGFARGKRRDCCWRRETKTAPRVPRPPPITFAPSSFPAPGSRRRI